jgi:hypothetical protein
MADDLTKDDLKNLARELDKDGSVELPESKGRSEESDKSESAPDDVEEESPDQDEIEKESKKDKSKKDKSEDDDGDSAESSDISDDDGEKKVSKDEKDRERFDRNWKKLEERKKEVEAKEKELKDRERKHQKLPSTLEEERDNDGYSVKDYQQASKKFREDGEDDLANQADVAARNLYNQGFQKVWLANLEELTEQFPDLSDAKKPLTLAANKVLDTLPFLRGVPDGCKYAVRIAQGDTSASMISELKAENRKLKKELDRLDKSTRLSGSGPSRLPVGDRDIGDLPRKEGRKALRAMAEAADRGEIINDE